MSPEPSEPAARARMGNRVRLLVLLGLVGGAVALFASGALDPLADPERVQRFLTENGALGPAVYVLSFALLAPFGVPGILFFLPASLVWPYWLAVAYSVLGAVGAGALAFGLSRWLAYDWVRARLPARLAQLTTRARQNELRTVIVIRLVFFLAAPAHWALGVSGVRFSPFLIGSAIGFTPPMMVWVALSREGVRLASGGSPWLWVWLGAVGLAGYLAYRRWFRAPVEVPPTSSD